MKDEKYTPGEETVNPAADDIQPDEKPAAEPVAKPEPEESDAAEVPEEKKSDEADEAPVAEENETDVKNAEENPSDETAESPEEADAEPEEPVDEYAIEDEPFVRKATPEEIAYYTQRITGEEHSFVTTAAPVRTRNPDQNRNVTNGIPQRSTSQQPRTSHPIHREAQPKKKSGVFPMIIAAALLVTAMLTSVVVGVNLAYSEKEDNRPSDFDMIEKNYDDAVPMDFLPVNQEPAKPADPETGDAAEDTEPAEPDTNPTEPETQPAETTPAETKPPETQPPETEPPSPQYTIKLDFFDRDDIVVSAEQTTLRSLLANLNVSLKDTDRPNIGLDDVIAADTTVKIDQILYKSETMTESIAYETEVIEIDTIPRGEVNYLQYGKEGSKNIYYTVEYINGQETNRTKDWEETIEWPVTERYEKGVGGSFVGADGVTYTYSLRRVVPATYYDINGPTWLGPDAGEWAIAVDFDYIPLGTELYVKNDKYDFGLRTAADTGSAIDEWEIDIWIGPDNPQLESFAFIGYHWDMEIYYVDLN